MNSAADPGQPAPRPRSAWKKFRRRAGAAAARGLGPPLLRLLACTWRVRRVGLEQREARDAEGRRAVFSFWHQQVIAAVGTHSGFPVRVLVSLHRDGETIARLAERLGYATVRGSTSAGAAQALREMTRTAADTSDAFAFTPDGPRGPAHSIAPGVIFLAAATRRPLVAVGFAASRFWQARSWDRMVLPKPFARVVVAYAAVAAPAADAVRQGPALEGAREELARAMTRAEQAARESLTQWMGRPAPEFARA